MAKDHVHQSHPDIVNRLKRAKGHIHRVIAMFDEVASSWCSNFSRSKR